MLFRSINSCETMLSRCQTRCIRQRIQPKTKRRNRPSLNLHAPTDAVLAFIAILRRSLNHGFRRTRRTTATEQTREQSRVTRRCTKRDDGQGEKVFHGISYGSNLSSSHVNKRAAWTASGMRVRRVCISFSARRAIAFLAGRTSAFRAESHRRHRRNGDYRRRPNRCATDPISPKS